MSHPFKPYELEVLKALLASEFSEHALLQMLDEASLPQVEYTNYGFYVSVQHPAIGKARRVHSGSPALTADLNQHSAGFVVFLENDALTLEVFPCDGEALPPAFRDSRVQLNRSSPAEKENGLGSSPQ